MALLPLHKVRATWNYDDDGANLEFLEQWDTPEKYAKSPVFVTSDDGTTQRELTFEEYSARLGNPDCYVSLYVIVERQCESCDGWTEVEPDGRLYGITFMDDEAYATGTFTFDNVEPLNDEQWSIMADIAHHLITVTPEELAFVVDSVQEFHTWLTTETREE